MTINRWEVVITGRYTGAGNPAMVGFVTAHAADYDKQAAQLLAYIADIGVHVGHEQAVVGMNLKIDSGPNTPLSFPSFYTTLRTNNGARSLPTLTAFGDAFGGGPALPTGISACVKESTVRGGKHNGRHFVPFLDTSCMTSEGTTASACAGAIEDSWETWMGTTVAVPTGTDAIPILPEVLGRTSPGDPTLIATLITGIGVSPLLSMLRSRKR